MRTKAAVQADIDEVTERIRSIRQWGALLTALDERRKGLLLEMQLVLDGERKTTK